MKSSGMQAGGTSDVTAWLLEGDPSIRWQTMRMLGWSEAAVERERARVAHEGWGGELLSRQDDDGLWAGGLYSPKWTSTTYTLLLLRRLGIPGSNEAARKGASLLLEHGLYHDGGINFFRSMKVSETCVTGMVLSVLAYTGVGLEVLPRIAGYLAAEQMPDGGWNCERYRGAVHASFHTTISVLEGLREYETRRRDDTVHRMRARGMEFLLRHRLFRSHRTGEVVDPRMTRLSFPPRWRYDILRALDHFHDAGAPRDERCSDAVDLLLRRRMADGRWPLQNRHPGRTWFEMETPGQPSRWNTLRALRVLAWWEEG